MKRLGSLWPRLVSFENLWRAWNKARRGKSRSPEVANFALDVDRNLLELQRQLVSSDYRPGTYRLFTLFERKQRLIAAAPFRDRVVHHAVMNVIEPPLDRRFIADSYACRTGKGTHRAVARYQGWARRYSYVLKLDIQRYFPSIDHDILKDKLARRIRDRRVLELLDRIIDGSPDPSPGSDCFPGDDLLTPLERRHGIPIGNLTSQFFANLYLDDMDHWIREQLRVPGYLRYVDDMVLVGDDKIRLADMREEIREHLARLRLRLHPNKAHLYRTSDGLNLLGYLVWPNRRQLRNDNGHRFARRLRRFARGYADGRLDWADFDPSVQAWIAHARHADTLGLRDRLFSGVCFRRGAGRARAPCGPGRLVEQQTEQGAFRQPQQQQPG